jgi:hypothetical protein
MAAQQQRTLTVKVRETTRNNKKQEVTIGTVTSNDV